MTRLANYIIVLFLLPVAAPSQTRAIRYHPEGEDFVITNGTRRFNRALYGTHTAFRVEAGDLPEFALYMPGMGGGAPHPTRVSLKTGEIRKPEDKYTTIKGLTNKSIDGGAAAILEMSLDPNKTLDHLVLCATARDVIIGLMSITLLKIN